VPLRLPVPSRASPRKKIDAPSEPITSTAGDAEACRESSSSPTPGSTFERLADFARARPTCSSPTARTRRTSIRGRSASATRRSARSPILPGAPGRRWCTSPPDPDQSDAAIDGKLAHMCELVGRQGVGSGRTYWCPHRWKSSRCSRATGGSARRGERLRIRSANPPAFQ